MMTGVTSYQLEGEEVSLQLLLDRFLWEHKVARKVKVSKLFLQLFSCTLFMGAKSCEKSLETFALDHNPAIWSKSLQTFLATEVARKVARRKLYRFGCPCYCQILVDCSLGSHNPIHKHTRVRAPHRRTPHETWRASTTSQKRLCCRAAAAATSIMMGLYVVSLYL